jgi:hypothetical protein
MPEPRTKKREKELGGWLRRGGHTADAARQVLQKAREITIIMPRVTAVKELQRDMAEGERCTTFSRGLSSCGRSSFFRSKRKEKKN